MRSVVSAVFDGEALVNRLPAGAQTPTCASDTLGLGGTPLIPCYKFKRSRQISSVASAISGTRGSCGCNQRESGYRRERLDDTSAARLGCPPIPFRVALPWAARRCVNRFSEPSSRCFDLHTGVLKLTGSQRHDQRSSLSYTALAASETTNSEVPYCVEYDPRPRRGPQCCCDPPATQSLLVKP